MTPIHEIDIVQNPRLATRYDSRPAGTILDRAMRQALDSYAHGANNAHVQAGPRLVRVGA